MPDLNDVLAPDRHRPFQFADFVNYTLRGAGQVVFMNNPITGFFILAGLFYDNWWRALCGLIALIAATYTSHLFGFERSARRSGLFGYNGLLVGLGLAFIQEEHAWRVIVESVVFGGMSTVVTVAVANAFVPVFNITPLTLPFNITIYTFIAASYQSSHMIEAGFIPAPGLKTVPIETESLMNDLDISSFLWGIVRGYGQVFFASSRVCALLIFIGMAFCSRISALVAFVGCTVGALTGWFLGAPLWQLYLGLYSYDAMLGSVSIGGFFFLLRDRTWMFMAANCAGCAIIHAAVSSWVAPFGGLSFTMGFNLSTFIFLLLQRSVSRVTAVELSALTTPEGNLRAANEGRIKGLSKNEGVISEINDDDVTVGEAASDTGGEHFKPRLTIRKFPHALAPNADTVSTDSLSHEDIERGRSN